MEEDVIRAVEKLELKKGDFLILKVEVLPGEQPRNIAPTLQQMLRAALGFDVPIITLRSGDGIVRVVSTSSAMKVSFLQEIEASEDGNAERTDDVH